MKVATLNCNGFQACVRKGFFDWLEVHNPDVICLQEVRFAQDRLVGKFAPPKKWHWAQVDAEKSGYSSVAIWSQTEPLAIHRSIGLDWADAEGRVVGMEFETCIIWSMYFPSGTSGDERQALKDEFLEHLTPWMADRVTGEKAVLICGDVNIAHTALDIFHDKSNANKSGFLPHERKWMTDAINSGWRDALRMVHPTQEVYSWWSNRSKTAREKNVGWRIDYQLMSQGWGDAISAEIHREPKLSDHAPVVIEYDMSFE
jgi:exodeoxyribonuclease-3